MGGGGGVQCRVSIPTPPLDRLEKKGQFCGIVLGRLIFFRGNCPIFLLDLMSHVTRPKMPHVALSVYGHCSQPTRIDTSQ